MENLGKKVGYLKGLLEGADIDKATGSGKLLAAMVELLGDLSDRVETMDELLDDLNDYVESIDDDLSELEGNRDDDDDDFLFPDDDDDDDDFDDAFGEGEDRLHLLRTAEGPLPEDATLPADAEIPPADDEPDALAGKLCPKCGRMFFASLDDAEDAEYLCPHCGERVTAVPLTPENAPMAKPIEED